MKSVLFCSNLSFGWPENIKVSGEEIIFDFYLNFIVFVDSGLN